MTRSFIIGGKLHEREMFEAVVTGNGGCVERLGLSLDGRESWDLWAKRPGEAFHMNGQWPGYCGRHTSVDGYGGKLVVAEGDSLVEKDLRDDSKPAGDPNAAIHGILPRFPHAISTCGGKVITTFTTAASDGHPNLVQERYWPFHHEVQDIWWVEPADPCPRVVELDPERKGVYLGAFCNLGLFTNTDSRAQPAARCYHTQWLKRFAGVDNKIEVRFRSLLGVHEKKDGILCPLGAPRFPLPEEYDYSTFKPLADDLDHGWDGVYTHIELLYPEAGLLIVIKRSSDFGTFVGYTPTDPDGPFFGSICGEWQTTSPNGFTLFAKGLSGTGAAYLKPGEKWPTWWRVEAYRLVR